MNRSEYLKYHEDLCNKARELSKAKNHDYAGAGAEDPFRNFRLCNEVGVASVEQGFLVRMLDKFSRLATFCRDGKLLVKDESVTDTLLDMVNYSCLFAAFLEEKKQSKKCDKVMENLAEKARAMFQVQEGVSEDAKIARAAVLTPVASTVPAANPVPAVQAPAIPVPYPDAPYVWSPLDPSPKAE